MLQAVDGALRLLRLFEEVDQERRVGEMAEMLDVDESTASRRHARQSGCSGEGSGQRGVQDRPELGRLGVTNMRSSHDLVE
jgi:hypothetical protein